MAKPKTEKTSAMMAAEKARERVKKAEEALAKKKDVSTETELASAKEGLAIARKEENADRFRRVGNPRMNAAKKAILAIGKLGVPSSYEYDETHVAKIESILNEAVKASVTLLRTAKSKTGSSKPAGAERFF